MRTKLKTWYNQNKNLKSMDYWGMVCIEICS